MKKILITIGIIILSATIAYYKGDLIPKSDEKAEPRIYTDQQIELASLVSDSKNQVVIVNNNKPDFTATDLTLEKGTWQTFSNLDDLNRVGVANAMLSRELMPREEESRYMSIQPDGKIKN
ncbi:hypothetical protein [Listeria newyorkensis]|uniref:hypothetical protein n=1 Tax=Listeria newyorkensis TaxID=1497681 RepID=UPI000D954335|nr:hypothetical protein [Listeria newyorkensis]SQC56817.1 Uncharacterised protein [Listeria newyorkensis]